MDRQTQRHHLEASAQTEGQTVSDFEILLAVMLINSNIASLVEGTCHEKEELQSSNG